MTCQTVCDDAPEPIVVEVCKQGPQGPGGADLQGPVVIAPAATEILDSFALGGVVRAIWYVTATDVTGLQRSATVDAHFDGSGNTSRTVYARYGEYTAFGVLVTNNAGTIELRITNNHGVNITARSVKLMVQ